MKVLIEEKDETQEYRVTPLSQFKEMTKDYGDRVEIFVPNLCGGETRITIFKSSIPEGNIDNLVYFEEKKMSGNPPLAPDILFKFYDTWIRNGDLKERVSSLKSYYELSDSLDDWINEVNKLLAELDKSFKASK